MLSRNFQKRSSINFAVRHAGSNASSHHAGDERSSGADASAGRLVTRTAAAAYLGVQPQTLAVWACTQRYQLPFVKVGRRVMYRLADLEAFVMANRHGHGVVFGGANG